MYMKKRVYTKEILEPIVQRSLSMAEVCRAFGVLPRGGNYKTIRSKISKFAIDTSHFTGQGWNTGKRFKPFSKKFELKDILVVDSTYTNTYKLKQRLIKEGLKKEQCESCNNIMWLGNKIPLELEHVNGINNDNRLENIQLLCPNCHALTSTYRGKNKNRYTSVAKLVDAPDLRSGFERSAGSSPV